MTLDYLIETLEECGVEADSAALNLLIDMYSSENDGTLRVTDLSMILCPENFTTAALLNRRNCSNPQMSVDTQAQLIDIIELHLNRISSNI